MGITRNKSLETFLLLSVCLAFVLVYWWERDGMYSIAVADEIAYVTCGVNLIARGEYTNAFGEPETWFPPTYPLLIGIASFGGHIDPHFTGRLVSLVFGIGEIVLIWATARRFVGGRAVPVLAGVILACNPTYQAFSFRALSEATATTMNLAAFYIWLTTYRHESKARWAIVGFLVGLSALSRPEGILLLPLWIGVDAWCKGTKRVACHALVSVIVCATSLLPYAAYLYRETGAFTITNKSEVNLADGRSAYYHTPREYIDAATLQMGYYPCDITFSQELQRYIHNVGQLGAAFLDIYAGWLSLGVLSCLAIGIVLAIPISTTPLAAWVPGTVCVSVCCSVLCGRGKEPPCSDTGVFVTGGDRCGTNGSHIVTGFNGIGKTTGCRCSVGPGYGGSDRGFNSDVALVR